MERIYYNEHSPGFLGSIKKLSNAVRGSTPINRGRKNRGSRHKIVKNWLNTQDTYTVHRDARLNFPRNHYFVFNIDDLWEADLIDMSKLKNNNDNYRYILTVIDVFSKFGFTHPLKTKGAAEVTKAFKIIIDNSEKRGAGFKRIPRVLQTDRGKEFKNAILKRFLTSRNISIQFPLTQSKNKASIAERFNRTIQSYIYKYFTAKKTTRYIDILANLTHLYNNSVHRTIKMKPINVDGRKVLAVYNNTHQEHKKKEVNETTNVYQQQPLEIGDSVRVVRRKKIFEPGYTNKWSSELFNITNVIEKKPFFFYKIRDSVGRPIREKFYKYELQFIKRK